MSMENVQTTFGGWEQSGPCDGASPHMLADLCCLYDAWNDAHEDAERAWSVWKAEPGPEPYVAYRAAADREDCAQDRLAGAH